MAGSVEIMMIEVNDVYNLDLSIKVNKFPIFDMIVDGFNISTLLEYAIVRDNLEIVRFLIERGHDVNYSNFMQPLHLAIYLKNYKIAKILYEAKAEITEMIREEAQGAGDDFINLIIDVDDYKYEDESEEKEEDYDY